MRQYYYANGDQQLGPFSMEELKSKNLKKDTYVWYEGLKDWTRASDLPEMNALFEAALDYSEPPRPTVQRERPNPPQNQGGYQNPRNQGRYQQQYDQDAPPRKPKTWLVESILTTIFCCIPLGIVGIVFAAQVDSKWNQRDYQGAQKSSDNAKLWTTIAFGVGIVVQGFLLVSALAGM